MKKLNSICLLLMCFVYGQVYASTQLNFGISNKTQEKIDAYISALNNIQNKGGILLLYERAQDLADVLELEIEDLYYTNPKEYLLLKNQLIGLDMHVGEFIGVVPDIEYFQRIAQKYSTEDDRKFFSLMHNIYPEDNFRAVWDYQLTDFQAVLDLKKINSTGILKQLVHFLKESKTSPYIKYIQKTFNGLVERLLYTRHFIETKDEVLNEYKDILETLKGDAHYNELEKKYIELQKQEKGFNREWQP